MIVRFLAALSFCIVSCACLGTAFAQPPQPTRPAVVVSATKTASVGKIEVSPQADGLTITIAVNAAVVPNATRLPNPDRLVFDFPGCELSGPSRHIAVNQGPVKELRASQFSVHPPVTRVVIESEAPLNFHVTQSGNEALILEIPFTKAGGSAAAPTSVSGRARGAVENERLMPTAEATTAVTTTPATMPQPPKPVQNPEGQIAGHATQPGPGAYKLMDRARALKVQDLQELEDKAAAGDLEAQTTLALARYAGGLLKKDDAEALRLLHQAADQGYMAAEEALGIFAEAGVGTGHAAPVEALHWYGKAAQQGSLDAATNMALIYANGRGVEKDDMQALIWFRRAAEGGNDSAQYNLAMMYERGEGVPQDYKEAMRWLTAAADQNLVPAMLDLADILLQPPDSTITKNVSRAVEYYERAADQGSAVAQATLGTIFTKGLQGKVDYEQAAKWYKKAADQGEADGQLGLGVSYALGHGVAVNFEEARRLLAAAADKGQVEAEYDLAIMVEEGKGGPPDRDLAAHYYEMAADKGLVKAQYRYGLLLARESESASSRIAAYKWLMLAQDSLKESSAALSDVRKSMSAEEINEADHEVDHWRLAHPHLGS